MAAALAAGVAVTIEGSYGAVQANRRIGNLYNDKIRAFAAQSVRNLASRGWTTGLAKSVEADSDRVLAIGCCWRKSPTSPPMSLANFTYGGQACTVINSIDAPDNQATATIYGVTAYCPETSIANATSSIISYTVSEDPIPTRPVICASKFFAGINQASPVQE
jgi:hypothetical protein